MTKYFKSVSTQLDMDRYKKLLKICEKEGCTPYAILNNLVTDYINSYPFDEKEGENVKSTGMGEVERGNKPEVAENRELPFLKEN